MTQRELSRRTGVPQATISRVERGLASPRFDTLERLLRACGKAVALVERPGRGVDVTLIRERLRLTPGARVRLAMEEWSRTEPLRRARRR